MILLQSSCVREPGYNTQVPLELQKMKIEKPAKQRSDVWKSKRKRVLFRCFFGLVKIIVQAFLIIDKIWPKIVDAYRELF